MDTETLKSDYTCWQQADCVFVFLSFIYYMLYPLSPAYWGSVYVFYFRMAAAAAIAFYLYFRHGRDVWDVKLVFLFGIWLIATRIINGDISLADEGTFVLDFWVSAILLGSLAMLPVKERERLFDLICAAMGIFHTALGLVALYSAIKMMTVPYPDFLLLDADFCNFHDGRLYMLACNTNICGNWFFVSMAMMLYELIKQKKWYLKLLSAIAGAVSFMGLALTRSRSSVLGAVFLFSALAVIIFLKHSTIKKKAWRLLSSALIFTLMLPAAYGSFGIMAGAVEKISALSGIEPTYEQAASPDYAAGRELPDVTATGTHERDVKLFTDTGRLKVYKSLLYTLENDPVRLIRGSLREWEMDISSYFLGRTFVHFHNSLLQSLDFTGIPGFIITACFFLLMALRSFRLIFSSAGTEIKLLALTMLGIMFYNMLETSAFYYTDIRELCFFAVSGMIIGSSKDNCPSAQGLKIK